MTETNDAIRRQRNLTPVRFATKAVVGAPTVIACARHFRNWAAVTARYVRPRPMTQPFVAHGRRGFSLTHWESSDVQTTWAVFCAKSYRVPRNPDTVLDLGANIGVFTIYATHVRGAKRVIALEPVRDTFEKLQANLANNKSDASVTVARLGVGGTAGRREVHLGVSSPHSSMYFRGDSRFESGGTEEIEVTTLDRLFQEHALESVDVCKMDCEGGEVEALLGASDDVLKRIRCITMEYHFPQGISDRPTLFRRLESVGFKCAWHSRYGQMAAFVR